ncbi:hypothetical protein OA187_04375 [Candidatus Pelagibacter sp.]|nr:hypothetical protein [Candidatus Pelagibacter sp.]
MIGNKINLQNFFLLILWTSLWLSIGINPELLIDYFNNSNEREASNFKFTLKFLRIFFPLLFSIFFFYLIIKKNLIFKRIFILNITSLLLVLYFFVQTVSLILSENNIINFYWIYTSVVIYLIVLSGLPAKLELIKFLFYISIFILFVVFFKFTLPMYTKFFSSNYSFYNMWPVIYDYDFSVPRPTGLSRTALILVIFLLCFEFNNYLYNKLKTPLLIFLGLTICLFQSRTILILWPLLIILSLILKNYKFVKIVKKLFILILLPILLFFSFNGFKILSKYVSGYIELSRSVDTNNKIDTKNLRELKNMIDEDTGKVQILRDTDPRSFSSFRTKHWREILNKTLNDNYLLGYGPMGDRFLIGTSASSLFFYSLASSGIVGLIIILLLSLRSIYLVLYFIVQSKKKDLDDYLIYSCIIITLVFIRGILETSIGIFSIDFCIYIIPALYIEYKYFLIKKII